MALNSIKLQNMKFQSSSFGDRDSLDYNIHYLSGKGITQLLDSHWFGTTGEVKWRNLYNLSMFFKHQ